MATIARAYDGFLEYWALASQSGTSAPTVTELRSTMRGTVSWSYSSTGTYLGTLTGAFASGTTATYCQLCPDGDYTEEMTFHRNGDNSVKIITYSSGTVTNGILNDTPIRMLIKPSGGATIAKSATNGFRYLGLINQSGTSNPTDTELVNNFNSGETWTRDFQGEYTNTTPVISSDNDKTMIRFRSIPYNVYNEIMRVAVVAGDPTVIDTSRRTVGLVDEVLTGAVFDQQFYHMTATIAQRYDGVKRYKAILAQTSTNAPTVDTVMDTLIGAPSYSYTSTGSYTLDITGEFTASKTFAFINSTLEYNNEIKRMVTRSSADALSIKTYDDGVATNALMTQGNTWFEIYIFE